MEDISLTAGLVTGVDLMAEGTTAGAGGEHVTPFGGSRCYLCCRTSYY